MADEREHGIWRPDDRIQKSIPARNVTDPLELLARMQNSRSKASFSTQALAMGPGFYVTLHIYADLRSLQILAAALEEMTAGWPAKKG